MTATPAPPALPPGVRSVGDLLRRAARRHGDRLAFAEAGGGGREIGWAELDRRVSAVATALRAAGLAPGERVLVVHPTSVAFVERYLGVLRAGLVAVPVNPGYTARELGHVAADAGAAALLSSAPDVLALADGLRAAAPSLRLVLDALPDVPDPARPDPAAPGPDVPDPAADRTGEQLAVLLYTSGTSGSPRGAMLPARALLANLAQVAALDPPLLRPDDVVLLPLPLFHVFGLNAGLGVALWHGVTTVLVDHFTPAHTAAVVAERHVDVVVGAPAMFAAWATHGHPAAELRGVRLLLSGAANLPASLVRAYAADGLRLYEGYGMTEAAPVLTCNAVAAPGGRDGRADPVPGSIGRPVPGVQVRLVDGDGDPVAEGDPGRLVVRGDNLFSGYWPDGAGGPADGWFDTGDLAVRDPGGDLRLVGRTTDLVVVSGFNVYPAEVESVLGAIPGVAEVAVVGRPDERTGEAVVAYVVALPGAGITAAGVREQAARSLARYKVPAVVELVDAVPHTVTGKVQKWRLGRP